METFTDIKEQFSLDGFTVIENIYTDEEIANILLTISEADTSKPTFRKTKDVFAIRQFLKEIPASIEFIFNEKLNGVILEFFGEKFFVVKSIYFDKPENSNWFVPYHQDLTISIKEKIDSAGFGPWTTKQNQFSVQPPLGILEDNFTIRIHLDDTDEENGALKVIPRSHLKGVYRPETINWAFETEMVCKVKKGGIMLMKPLLLHSSGRTTTTNKRRVIHIEFSRCSLPNALKWAECAEPKGCH